MTDDEDLTAEDFENFDEKSKEDKLDTIQRLHRKIEEGEDLGGLLQEVGLEGELQVRVLDEDGDEKQVEKKSFEDKLY